MVKDKVVLMTDINPHGKNQNSSYRVQETGRWRNKNRGRGQYSNSDLVNKAASMTVFTY